MSNQRNVQPFAVSYSVKRAVDLKAQPAPCHSHISTYDLSKIPTEVLIAVIEERKNHIVMGKIK